MKLSKRKQLERVGFQVGTIQDFLGLSDEETALIDLKVRLLAMVKAVRRSRGLTQHQLAKLLGSSQSRVAKMEAADPKVSLDLICRALFAMGISRQNIGKRIASQKAA
jgi:DNA-binding XRE family transcriptional regulator